MQNKYRKIKKIRVKKGVWAQAKKDFNSGIITIDDLRVIEGWIKMIEDGFYFSQIYEDKNLWRDHSLVGKWKGYRSSSFSQMGRIIYKVESDLITIFLVRITGGHNYECFE